MFIFTVTPTYRIIVETKVFFSPIFDSHDILVRYKR